MERDADTDTEDGTRTMTFKKKIVSTFWAVGPFRSLGNGYKPPITERGFHTAETQRWTHSRPATRLARARLMPRERERRAHCPVALPGWERVGASALFTAAE